MSLRGRSCFLPEAIPFLLEIASSERTSSSQRHHLSSQRQEDIFQSWLASFDFFHADTFPA